MAKTRILVVDDDTNLLDLMLMRLEASGYDVTAIDHENRAREAAAREIFDVAVVDLQLVKQDGLLLMDELHSMQPEMPVIILTAHGSIENAVEAMERGAFTYLTKPFDSRELILQIERATERNKLTGEINRLAKGHYFSPILLRLQQILFRLPAAR